MRRTRRYSGPNLFSPPPTILARAGGGIRLTGKDPKKAKAKGRSASAEVDGPLKYPEVSIFEEVDATDEEEIEEFEPLSHEELDVVWDDDGVREMAQDRWEAMLEDLFATPEEGEDLEAFEEVRESIGWSKGEVIWEGMDFDQMFTDPGEFHEFELLSRKDQRAFLRERLRTQQASGVAEAGDDVIALETDRRGNGRRERPEDGTTGQRVKGKEGGSLVSYETETEHRPEDLDLGMSRGRPKRRRRV